MAFIHKVLTNPKPMTHRKKDMPASKMSDEDVRIDKWLWAARFFRTRQLAAEAIKSGKVEVNGIRAKPARSLSLEDTIRLRKEKFKYELVVKAIAVRRQPASKAVTLYEETSDSIAEREKQKAQIRLQSQQVRFDRKKPDRRHRQVSRLVKRSNSRGDAG